MAPRFAKWCDTKGCGAKNGCNAERCHKCDYQLPKWASQSGARVPGSAQDAKAKEKAWNDKLAADKKTKDKKAKEQRDREEAALKCLCCCGKGHLKADCRQADKTCNNCGKAGHLSHVCRAPADGKPTGAKNGAKGLTDADFAAEAAKRGFLPPAAPAEDKAVVAVQPTVDTLVTKKKALETATKTFETAAAKVYNLRDQLAKANVALTAASEAQIIAERELAQVVAVVCVLPPPVAAPLAVAKTAPAIDLQQFLLAKNDPQKLQELVVFMGESFDLDHCGAEDRVALDQRLAAMTASFSTQILNVFPPNFLQDLENLRVAVDESRAKKRKGPDGGAAQTALASTASPAAVGAAAELARKAAEEAAALQDAADIAKKAEEKAQREAAEARRTAEAEAKVLAQSQETARLQALAKAEAEAKEAAAQKEIQDKEAKLLAEKQAKEDDAKAKLGAMQEIKETARLVALKRLDQTKRASSQPPEGGQGEGFGAKKLQVSPGATPSPPLECTKHTQYAIPGAVPGVSPADLAAPMDT